MATAKDETAKSKAPATAAKLAAQKAAGVNAPAKKPSAKTTAQPKTGGAMITVKQVGSPIGRQKDQRATLIGLGLNKMHRMRELQDSAEVRGMINKIPHLVKIVKK